MNKANIFPKKAISLILAGALILGLCLIPVLTRQEEQEVSDVFYIQIYGADDQVLSKYQVSLTGLYANAHRRRITQAQVVLVAGEECHTSCQIDGYSVTVRLTHPTEGYLEKSFLLGSNGRFF